MTHKNPFPTGQRGTEHIEDVIKATRGLEALIVSGRYIHLSRMIESVLDPARAQTFDRVSGGDGNDIAQFLAARQPYVDRLNELRDVVVHAEKSMRTVFVKADKLIQRGLRAQVESTSIETCAGCGAETILPDAEPGRPRTQCQECAAKSRREQA